MTAAYLDVTFTGVIVSVNQVSHNLSNYLPAGAAEKFTPEEKDNAIFGSKFVMILEEFMLANTWLCKACLLIFLGLKQNRLVKIVGAYCVFGYVLVQILYLGILSAILNRYYNFTEPYGSLIYLNWYVGEASTSVFVSNVPHLWPLLSRLFSLSAFISARRTGGSGSNGTPGRGRSGMGGGDRYGSKSLGAGGGMKTKRYHPSSGYFRTESEERIIAGGGGGGGGGGKADWPLSSSSTSPRGTHPHTSAGGGGGGGGVGGIGGGEGVGLEMGRLDAEDRRVGYGGGKGMGYTTGEERPMGYMASAAGGGDSGGDLEKAEVKDGIVRTVEVRQYSS
ncbi:MAG: hypothetical protein L6R41_001301 [Letrouitia leprolyta]|nr:MAG: hypothetical protein L6R41_001301 [Letrouitia leprolyta]